MATPLRRQAFGKAAPRFSLRSSHRNPLSAPASRRATDGGRGPAPAALNAARDPGPRRRDGHGGRRNEPRR